MRSRTNLALETLSSIFQGLEGGFAVFSAILAGLIFLNKDQKVLITTGVIGILVSAFNSSVVRFNTEHFNDEADGREKKSAWKNYYFPAILEFLMYVLVCLFLLIPLFVFDSINNAIIACCVLTIIFLFIVGCYRGYIVRGKLLRDGYELAFSGLAIILVGAMSGFVLSSI